MFVEYRVLKKTMLPNVDEIIESISFFEIMEKLYKDKGKETPSPWGIWYVEEKFYEIDGNKIYVGKGPIYGIHASKLTSVIIDGDNENQIFEITSKLEEETEFALIEVEHGN